MARMAHKRPQQGEGQAGIKGTPEKIGDNKAGIDPNDLRRALKQKTKTGDPDIDGVTSDDEDDQFDINGHLARAGISNWHRSAYVEPRKLHKLHRVFLLMPSTSTPCNPKSSADPIKHWQPRTSFMYHHDSCKAAYPRPRRPSKAYRPCSGTRLRGA